MNNKKEDIVCFCSGTTRQKIKELIESGADSVDKISRATGAVSGCAACDIPVQELLINHKKRTKINK